MKINILAHNYTGNSLTVVFSANGKVETKIVESSHPNWRQVQNLYKQGKYAEMVGLLDIGQAINAKFNGSFSVQNGSVYYKGEKVSGFLFDRIIAIMREGLPHARLLKFAENLYLNPSARARAELYKFLDSKGEQNGRLGGFPITEDGCFLAYKGVQSDFYSITGGSAKVLKGKVQNGRIFNGVGEKIEVERGSVDDDASRGCSYGLHAGSWEYANGFKGNGRMVIVKINPKDVVSVPHDCNCQKLRTCAYEVIAEEGRKLSETRDVNFDRAAKVRNATKYAPLPKRDANGRFVSAN